MSTIMTLRLGPTWYDLYRDPDELAAVQAIIAEHLAPGEALDWQAILRAETDQDVSYSFTSYEPPNGAASAAFVFPSALYLLHGRASEQAPLPVDFVPFHLTAEVIPMRLQQPHAPMRFLCSSWPIVERWTSWGSAVHATVEQRARRWEQGDDVSNAETNAYCLWAVSRIAQLSIQYRLPIRLSLG